MIELCDIRKCIACGACVQICPKNAVRLEEDCFGNFSPCIDSRQCVSCGLCRKSCPILSPREKHDILACYAAWGKDEEERKGSSSGGTAYLLGKQIIDQGGVVFGCCFTPDGCAEQRRIETLEELEATRGSKYLQSSMGGTYRETKELLQSGRKVLWIGTPCQIAGLYSFLGTRPENLFTADLVCHGVPPAKYWKDYQQILFADCQNHTFVFRDNLNGFAMQTYAKQKLIRKRYWTQDPYYYAFMYGIDYRESCYSCPFASPQRVGDLTIGDFWGLDKKSCPEKVPLFPSLVLVNTEQGRKILDEAEQAFILIERSIEEGITGNKQLQEPTRRHPLRATFLQNFQNYGFNAALEKTGINRICRINYFIFLMKQPLRFLRDLICGRR